MGSNQLGGLEDNQRLALAHACALICQQPQNAARVRSEDGRQAIFVKADLACSISIQSNGTHSGWFDRDLLELVLVEHDKIRDC